MKPSSRDIAEGKDGITTIELPSVTERATKLGVTVPQGDGAGDCLNWSLPADALPYTCIKCED
jgi:hypothetical protein